MVDDAWSTRTFLLLQVLVEQVGEEARPIKLQVIVVTATWLAPILRVTHTLLLLLGLGFDLWSILVSVHLILACLLQIRDQHGLIVLLLEALL